MNRLKKERQARQEMLVRAARNDERRLLVQELHSDLGATIAGIINFLRIKSMDAKDAGESFEFLKMSEILQQTYNSIRLRSHEMYSTGPLLTFWEGLVSSVKAYCPHIHIHSEIKSKVGDFCHLAGGEVKATLLFTLKEAVANVIKHAGSDEVSLLLVIEKDELQLLVRDEREASSYKSPSEKRGIGLKLIQEKVEESNGYFEYVEHETGTAIKITLPF